MKLKQSRQLLSFLSSLNLELDGSVSRKPFTEYFTYVSRYYTPELKASNLATDMLGILSTGTTFIVDNKQEPGELIKLARLLDLKNTDPMAYSLLQLISLEIFSLVTVIDMAPDSSDEYLLMDAKRLHGNIKYLQEYLSDRYQTNDGTIEIETAVIVYRIIRLLDDMDIDSAYMNKVISGNTLAGANNAV